MRIRLWVVNVLGIDLGEAVDSGLLLDEELAGQSSSLRHDIMFRSSPMRRMKQSMLS
ncbi:hypothetical protein ACFPYJ_02935 [Paenibacillus solisilvae]|uniref:Uncharacterized protein n=1 Tax=Paenibacillus solisilvae TaxID=2486751 RepID=A0ABW0VRI2_9BACL